jgi:hypothetical protein
MVTIGGSGGAAGAAYNSDADVAAGQMLFPLEDADKAWNNTLQQQGYNIYRANPFIASLQRAGRGLRQAFLQDRAGGGTSGLTPTAPNSPYAAQDFNNFLVGALKAPGGINKALGSAYASMPSMIQNIRSYQDSIANGGQDAASANPYMQLLADEMSASGGKGTANALSYLRAPLMGADLGRSYSSMLSDIVDSGNRQLALDPGTYSPGSQRDIWSYIFGKAGSPF